MTWVEPDNKGSPIIGYTVTIRESDLTTYSVEPTNCDVSLSAVTTCTIPVSALRAAPHSLDWGDSVFAKVIATNNYGNSVESLEGNGAVITTAPGVPTDLSEVYEQRTKSTLGLSWVGPLFTGGDVIEDYRVSIAE